MPTLAVDVGEASLESAEEPDFLLMTFRTEVERGGAGGGVSMTEPPPSGWLMPTVLPLPLSEVCEAILVGREVCEARLIEPVSVSYTHLTLPTKA